MANQLGETELAAWVARAAEQLLTDLEHAEHATDRWRNASLGESLVSVALWRCLAQVDRCGVRGEANRLPSSHLWRIAGERLSCGRLISHARLKPHGYAGDYQMLEWICHNTTCDDPLGRLLDTYFLAQTAPTAVRARTEYAAGMIAKLRLDYPGVPFRIVSVGSGPAIDVARGIEMLPVELSREMSVTLLDLDARGLQRAAANVGKQLPAEQIDCRRENLFRLSSHAGQATDESLAANVLICSGLFDYLPDEPAAAMLAWFHQQLTPGGRAIVGNFTQHASRPLMEWIGNWYLLYRTPDDMRRLATMASLAEGSFAVTTDRTGAVLLLEYVR